MGHFTRRHVLNRTGLLGLGLLAGGPAGLRAATEEVAFLPAVDLAERLRTRQIGCEELTRHFIARIERHDERLNAVVVRDFERALAAARQADAALARGQVLGPLHGLPMTIKESYDIAGLPTTWGRPDASKTMAREDAVVVQRFKQAGAVFLGKTNVPINLGDFQSYNAIYGTTNNPWDVSRTPGGSSGGSAAALAAGLTSLESGSDIGGSIRNPAHFCGVYGHKPTLGIVPGRGHQPPGVPPGDQHPDLAVVGPMARSADDLALALDLLAGPDGLRAPGWQLTLPPPRMQRLANLRVALWPDDPVAPVDEAVSARVRAVGDRLAQLGARVSDTARPAVESSMYQQTYLALLDPMTNGPASDLKHVGWMELNGRRGAFRAMWQQFFKDWDLVICPATATSAFPQDQSAILERQLTVNGGPRPYFEQLFWAGLATLSYLPSTVFPTGQDANGLPIGLQAIGAEFDDRTTIQFARLMADELGGFTPPDGFGAG